MQMNTLVQWLFDRHPSVQFLAVHLAGSINGAADSLSRGKVKEVNAESQTAGNQTIWLYPDRSAFKMLRSVARETQRV